MDAVDGVNDRESVGAVMRDGPAGGEHVAKIRALGLEDIFRVNRIAWAGDTVFRVPQVQSPLVTSSSDPAGPGIPMVRSLVICFLDPNNAET